VVTPVVDHVLGLPTVDPERVALLGISFGGYLAPRAAAFEHRLAACIANGGVFDFMAPRLPSGMSRQAAIDWVSSDPRGADGVMRAMMHASTDSRWGIENGMFTFRASSPADYFVKALDYTLAGIAEKITCPMLVIDDPWYPGQARQLFEALTCPKTFMVFTAEEGAEDHCQLGSPLLSGQRIFDWLQETLAC